MATRCFASDRAIDQGANGRWVAINRRPLVALRAEFQRHSGPMSDPDVVIIGTGPAGVSAAYPLVEAGLQVLMIDGGRKVPELALTDSYLDLRRNATSQWKIFLGEQLETFAASGSNSP